SHFSLAHRSPPRHRIGAFPGGHPMRPFPLAARVLLILAALAFCAHASAATFTVTNTTDSGAGSLRQAILDANGGGAGPHTIAFDIPGSGVHTIAVSSALPTSSVSGGLTVDGTTQPGYAGTPLIAIACANVGVFGFTFTTGGTIRGLSIGGCGAAVNAGGGG